MSNKLKCLFGFHTYDEVWDIYITRSKLTICTYCKSVCLHSTVPSVTPTKMDILIETSAVFVVKVINTGNVYSFRKLPDNRLTAPFYCERTCTK